MDRFGDQVESIAGVGGQTRERWLPGRRIT